jgi:hypothetical protein
MAYDPNDAADKKILKDLIAAALAEQAIEHEQDVSGLKTKNVELLAKLKKAETGENNAAEVSRLEALIEENKGQLKEANKAIKDANKIIIDTQKALETESGVTRTLLVDNGLTEALTKANVPVAFLPAVKALLSSKVELKTEGNSRVAKVGDKSLGDYITEWSQGDEGKHYVAAPGNGGAGAGGNKVPGQKTSKTMTRAAYDEMPPENVGAFFAEGGTLTE